MIRDMSDWPEPLRKDLAIGTAPVLDRLAALARGLFRAQVYLGGCAENGLWDLRQAVTVAAEMAGENVIVEALLELRGLRRYALPYTGALENIFGNYPFPESIEGRFLQDDMVAAAIMTRARLDPWIEREELRRQWMIRLGPPYEPVPEDIPLETLAGAVGYLTFDQLVDHVRDQGSLSGLDVDLD